MLFLGKRAAAQRPANKTSTPIPVLVFEVQTGIVDPLTGDRDSKLREAV